MTHLLPTSSVFVPGPLPVSHIKAHRLLAFYQEYHRLHGYSPTLAECVAADIGFKSTSSIARTLRWLEGMGLVTSEPWLCRSVTVMQP